MHSQRRRRRSVPAVVATALVAGLLATPVTVSEAATGNPAIRCKDASAFLATIGNDDFCLRAFTAAGDFTWTVPEGIDSFRVIAVGGGGGGGGGAVGGAPFFSGRIDAGGGGGGGGAFWFIGTEEVGARAGDDRDISITVGAGGEGGAGAPDASSAGSDGTDGGFTTVKWADDTSITNVGGAEGGKGGTTVDPGVGTQEQPANTPETKGGAGGIGVDPLAAGGGGGRGPSAGRTGGEGTTTAFQDFWPAGAPGSRPISGGGGGGATCTDNVISGAPGGGSGGAGATSQDTLPAGKGTFGGGGGGGAGSGSSGCSGASTAGADGGDGAVFFRYAAFRTDVTSVESFDIVIFVAAQDADPRTISIAGFANLNDGVPTFTVERDGTFTFDIPADGFTTTPVSGDLGSPGPVVITQARDDDTSWALSLFWTNPAGQEKARIQAERIAVRPELDDLDPFALFITSEQFGFTEAQPFTGETEGPRTVTTGLVAGAENKCQSAENDEGECRLQARLQFLPSKDPEDIGAPERSIRARFVFTILDE